MPKSYIFFCQKTTKTLDIYNSSSWGNYSNSTGGAATNAGDSAKPGGTNEYWKVNNIYDIAGNVREWTQEKYSTGTNRAYRGGSYNYNGDYYPATSRSYSAEYVTNSNVRV